MVLKNKEDTEKTGFKPEDMFPEYRTIRINTLEETDSLLYQLEHRSTGARHIHIGNSDKENTFGVAFRTVPEDSTGVAHILEHTVLCGSEKFKVRDPFFSMLKRGLSTFMNAFTASDWTMYPFSTQNKKDFYNLMDVYLDAAFFPEIDALSFKQEGHRLEVAPVETPEGKPELIYKGVVYNEMKGAMSSPGQIMGRSLLRALFPNTTYRFNSGGEPSDIPKLTHQGLKAFHSRFYHPSNAFFYTYGSIPLKEHLHFIHKKVLKRFSKTDPDSRIPSQPRWTQPKQATFHYPLSKVEDPSKKYQACVAWLTTDIKDSFEVLVLTILEQILLGNAASPLRKALIDSNLGSSLSDATGFDPDMRDTMFACGLKDIALDSSGDMEALIFKTLRDVVEGGIETALVDSAIHQIEFQRKEITNTPHPFGIKQLLSFTATWIHDGDPVSWLKFGDDLDRLKKKIAKGPFLEGKIRHYFLDNPHRVLFTLAPDQNMESREEKRVKAELEKRLSQLDPNALESIKKDAIKLADLQDKKEDLSSLPTLALSDVPPEIEIIRPDSVKGVSFATCYNKPTSGILYFSCPTGLSDFSKERLFLIPFFCRAFVGVGTRKRDYARMAERMDLYTGGISLSPFAGTGFSEKKRCMPFLSLQGKSLDRNGVKLFDIIRELVAEYAFSDLERLKSLLFQYRAAMESSIVASGHSYAMSLASRHLTQASTLGEMWHGISQYRFIKTFTEQLDGSNSDKKILKKLADDLTLVADSLFLQGNLKPVIVGGESALVSADINIRSIVDTLPKRSFNGFNAPAFQSDIPVPFEGWSTSTSVSFVAQAFKTVRLGHKDSPGLAVLSKMLRSLYLHREIREKGGAYGGFAVYNSEEGIFSFGSYRDPNIRKTLDVYQQSCDFILNGDYSETDVKEAILQVCADIDKPETPGPASIKAFYRDILMLTDEARQRYKASLLGLDKTKIRKTAQMYFDIKDKEKGTAVISSQEQLENANTELAPGQIPFELKKI